MEGVLKMRLDRQKKFGSVSSGDDSRCAWNSLAVLEVRMFVCDELGALDLGTLLMRFCGDIWTTSPFEPHNKRCPNDDAFCNG
jgi:hypothetical protein